MCVIKRMSDKGNGIISETSFKIKKEEMVLVGKVEKELDHNHSHAPRVGIHTFILPDSIYRTTNHSCDPICGIHLA